MRISKPSAGARMRRRWREARWRELEAAALVWSQSATRSDTWTSRASLKPGLPRTAKKIWFSLSTILGKSGVAEKTHKLKSGFFCVRILMILWSGLADASSSLIVDQNQSWRELDETPSPIEPSSATTGSLCARKVSLFACKWRCPAGLSSKHFAWWRSRAIGRSERRPAGGAACPRDCERRERADHRRPRHHR